MMEPASCLSKDEIKQTLRELSRKPGKNIPLAKYLCVPSSQQLQKSIHVWNAHSPLFALLKCAFHRHGVIAATHESETLKEAGKLSASDGEESCTAQEVHRDRRNLKGKRLRLPLDPNCKLFWSHIIFGANQVARVLESSQHANETEHSPCTYSLECVLLDSGWITSQLGHHISHLCSELGIRLVSVAPSGELASCLSTPLRPLKKAIAVGIRSSFNTPPELTDWIGKLKVDLQPLVLPKAFNTVSPPPPMSLSKVVTSVDASANSETPCLDNQDGEPWSSYVPSAQNLYLFSPPSMDRILTVSMLCHRLSSISREGTKLDEDRLDDDQSFPSSYPSSSFKPALLKTVPPRTDEERRIRKGKKRLKRRRSLTGADSVN